MTDYSNNELMITLIFQNIIVVAITTSSASSTTPAQAVNIKKSSSVQYAQGYNILCGLWFFRLAKVVHSTKLEMSTTCQYECPKLQPSAAHIVIV